MKKLFRKSVFAVLSCSLGLVIFIVLPTRAAESISEHPVYIPLLLNKYPPAPIFITGKVTVKNVFYNGAGRIEPDEYVEFINEDTRDIQLQNWKLVDNQSHWFTFPAFTIKPGQVCRVYTNQNHTQWCGFNYHHSMAIWNNTGDCAFLHDPNGVVISKKCY